MGSSLCTEGDLFGGKREVDRRPPRSDGEKKKPGRPLYPPFSPLKTKPKKKPKNTEPRRRSPTQDQVGSHQRESVSTNTNLAGGEGGFPRLIFGDVGREGVGERLRGGGGGLGWDLEEPFFGSSFFRVMLAVLF